MAKLIKCKVCGKDVASNCKKCIHCGAKIKKSSGCGLFLIIMFLVFVCAMLSTSDQNQSSPKQTPPTTTVQDHLNKEFAKLKKNPDIEKYSVSANKISIVYKKELPEMSIFNMRNYAETGSRIVKGAFTAECSVSAEPNKILYSERRENKKTVAIRFSENKHTKNKKAEQIRLTEAKRQKSVALEKEIKSRAYAVFYNKFISSWDGSCRPVVNAVKSTMHDPSSFQHVKTQIFSLENKKDEYSVQMTFRGKNAIGAIVTNTIEANITKDGRVSNLHSR